ncbi:hypothetical protein BGW36DRAFT_451988 [Talaromyces proteolyticus]|uniref:Uncharacterized protein n=1 Tax=Talaromyces proteolyticus TaxID=1131652 RepID=A0AAD4PZK6_9EURO|nr:uncharacterized protein BGW36DRAFT_451988 [Talaromyces proteolyticus]KAH8696457.1 hypothetical protein BGW36DRAFT_451988 [Talaromyces proteolyticus]
MTGHDKTSLYAKHYNPIDEVHELVSKYELIQHPSAALHHIKRDADFYGLFCEIIERQISIIMSRSQAFDDGHVTVYDKCLLALCRNGQYIDSVSGQELYIREFMGIDPNAPEPAVEEIIAKHTWTKGILAKFSQPRTNALTAAEIVAVKTEAVTAIDSSPQNSGPFSDSYIESYEIPNTGNPVINEHIYRLIEVYFEAKYEFYKLKSSDYQENASAAKYLRDSAENALNYINMHRLTPEVLIRELETVSDYANTKSVEFLGGKKRRFEIRKDSSRGERPMRRPMHHRSPSPYYKGQRGGYSRERYRHKRGRREW